MTKEKVENLGEPDLQRDSGSFAGGGTQQELPSPAQFYDERSDALADREVYDERSEEEARASAKIGEIVADKYKILGLLGVGGMSAVYRAEHMFTNKIVALKLMHGKLLNDANSIRRFQQEARAASRLTHPHAITVHDMGLTDAQPYLVMDCLEGKALSTVIRQEGQLAAERAIKVFIEASSALAEAHKLGIVHRDLKPSNIMLVQEQGETDFVKIVDFGIAKILSQEGSAQKLTTTGEVFGSPMYMSPEQCAAKPMDHRSDIYSMGCLMYESLCGDPPFEGENVITTLFKQLNEPPPPLKRVRGDASVVSGLNRIVQKTLAKDPAQRYQSVSLLSDDLMSVQKLIGKNINPIDRLFLTVSDMHLDRLIPATFSSTSAKIKLAVSLTSLSIAAVLLSPDYGIWKDPPQSERMIDPVPISFSNKGFAGQSKSNNPSADAQKSAMAQVALTSEYVYDHQRNADTMEKLARREKANGDLMLSAHFSNDALDHLQSLQLRRSLQAVDLLNNESECFLYMNKAADLKKPDGESLPEEALAILQDLENTDGPKALRAQACFAEYLLQQHRASSGAESTASAVLNQFLNVAYVWKQFDKTRSLFGEESPLEMNYHLALTAVQLADYYPELLARTNAADEARTARAIVADSLIELNALSARLSKPSQIAATLYDTGAVLRAKAYEDRLDNRLEDAESSLLEAEKCFMQANSVNDSSAAKVLFDLADLQWKRHAWLESLQTRAQARQIWRSSHDRTLS